MKVNLLYGEGHVEVHIPDGNLMAVLRSSRPPDSRDEVGEVRLSLENPVAGGFRRGSKALLLVTDYTRPTPLKTMLPPVFDRLERLGYREFTVLVANGLHEPASRELLEEFLGSEVFERAEVVNHDVSKRSELTYVGETRMGTPLWVNSRLFEADLRVGCGVVEPHFFAGYSGGRKILLPGVAGKDAVFNNHSLRMIGDPKARAGILSGNPIHEDMIEFMRQTRLNFIVNTTINKRKEITGIFAGDPIEAHLREVEFLDKHVKIAMEGEADIVITTNGGYPLDRDVYQAVKGMDTAATIVRRGGVIIIAAECRDGLGGHKEFVELTKGAGSPAEIIERIRKSEPIYDQWEAQVLARVLEKARVILVSDHLPEKVARDLLLDHAKSLEEALEIAYGILGRRDARVVAIPEGPYIIPVREM